MGSNNFVFVVCGGAEHIEALHYSLAALKKFSKKDVYVLTDSVRNEIPINHNKIIDVRTPENLNHHQASIFLKTSVHRYLPQGNLYCYLDTDVVAVSEKVDEVFNEFLAPITFAPDHCVADQFSPSAVKCGCTEKFAGWKNELRRLFAQYKYSRPPENIEKKEILEKKLEEIKLNNIRYQWIAFRFNLSRTVFKLDEDSFLDKKNHVWVDKNGQPILYERDIKDTVELIEEVSPYRQNAEDKEQWLLEGVNIFDVRCVHLFEEIEKQFRISVLEKAWQHWNGGVFLFNDSSRKFLEMWHEKTMCIFELPEWKTRDQGTLIATVWALGLQNHITLPKKFNLIADFGHQKILHTGDLNFTIIGEQESVQPYFIHVYHHWADKKWDVWQAVEKATGIEIDPDVSTVNGMWIGKKLSKIELLTIHSFLKYGYRFRLWLYEPLETPLPKEVIIADANEIVPREKVFCYKNKNQFGHGKGSVAGFSDIFRYKLLYEKGGWWTDMDITCLKSLDYDKPYFFRRHHELNVVGNVLKCPAKSELMKRCYEEAIIEIDENNTDWHKPIDILNKHIDALKLQTYIVDEVSNHDRWEETEQLLYETTVLPESWNFIHWQNEEWRNQRLNKNHFPHQGTLVRLLAEYKLYEPPKSVFAEWRNRLEFSRFFRNLRKRF